MQVTDTPILLTHIRQNFDDKLISWFLGEGMVLITGTKANYNPGQNCWNTFGPIFENSLSPPGSMLKHDV